MLLRRVSTWSRDEGREEEHAGIGEDVSDGVGVERYREKGEAKLGMQSARGIGSLVDESGTDMAVVCHISGVEWETLSCLVA
jgi:hypothetical protein